MGVLIRGRAAAQAQEFTSLGGALSSGNDGSVTMEGPDQRPDARVPEGWFSSEGQDHGLALPFRYSTWLFRCAYLCLLSALVAASMGKWDLFLVPLGVGLTSVNYWRRPDYGWRRFIDIAYVQVPAPDEAPDTNGRFCRQAVCCAWVWQQVWGWCGYFWRETEEEQNH